MNCNETLEFAAAHVLGALDATDVARFETVLAQHPDARSELAGFYDVTAALTLVLIKPPPPSLRAKVLGRVTAFGRRTQQCKVGRKNRKLS